MLLQDSDHMQLCCYFADKVYETKCVWVACPYQQSSNTGLPVVTHTTALLFCWYGLWNQMCLNCVPLAANWQRWVATMMSWTHAHVVVFYFILCKLLSCARLMKGLDQKMCVHICLNLCLQKLMNLGLHQAGEHLASVQLVWVSSEHGPRLGP